MKKGKPLGLVLAAALLLAGCSGGEATAPAGTETTQTPASGPEKLGAEIAETELYSSEGVTIVAAGLEESLFGPELRLLITNDSDKNVAVTTQQLSINGYMMATSGMVCEVNAGKKAMDGVTLLSSELEQAGIQTIGEAAFYLHISDADSQETLAESALLTLRTSAFGKFTQETADAGEPVYEKNGIRVICQGLREDDLWNSSLVFYIENGSDQPVTVYAEDVSIDGFMADASLWADLRAHTKIVDGMYLMDLEHLAPGGISGIREMEFSLWIISGEDWSAVDSTDPITVKFS